MRNCMPRDPRMDRHLMLSRSKNTDSCQSAVTPCQYWPLTLSCVSSGEPYTLIGIELCFSDTRMRPTGLDYMTHPCSLCDHFELNTSALVSSAWLPIYSWTLRANQTPLRGFVISHRFTAAVSVCYIWDRFTDWPHINCITAVTQSPSCTDLQRI